MIFVKRKPGEVPKNLEKRFRDDRTEFDRAFAHYVTENKSGSYDFSRYSGADVKRALDDIFHGKCAYCESFYAKTQPVDVEHYRPKGEVEGAPDHRGYWWLAMNWENLVPSCIDCNRRRGQQTPNPDEDGSMVALNVRGDFARGKTFLSGKHAGFPLESNSPRAKWDAQGKAIDLDSEKRLLIDPTRDHPDDHLVFYVDRSSPEKLVSFVYPKPLSTNEALALPILGDPEKISANADRNSVSAIGAVSIQVYGLNRLSLVQARTKMLRDLEFLLEMSISLQSLHSEIDDRIADRKDRIESATGTAKADLKKDQTLDERISTRFTELTQKILIQMTDMTAPTAQFSALANAWLQSFVQN